APTGGVGNCGAFQEVLHDDHHDSGRTRLGRGTRLWCDPGHTELAHGFRSGNESLIRGREADGGVHRARGWPNYQDACGRYDLERIGESTCNQLYLRLSRCRYADG